MRQRWRLGVLPRIACVCSCKVSAVSSIACSDGSDRPAQTKCLCVKRVNLFSTSGSVGTLGYGTPRMCTSIFMLHVDMHKPRHETGDRYLRITKLWKRKCGPLRSFKMTDPKCRHCDPFTNIAYTLSFNALHCSVVQPLKCLCAVAPTGACPQVGRAEHRNTRHLRRRRRG